MKNIGIWIRQFVCLVFVMDARDKMAPTPWDDQKLTDEKYAALIRLGWKTATKGQMQMCLSFDLPGGSKAYIGNGDLAGENNNAWYGLIEGTMSRLTFFRPIMEFGPLADSEVDITEVWERASDTRSLQQLLDDEAKGVGREPFQLRPRS